MSLARGDKRGIFKSPLPPFAKGGILKQYLQRAECVLTHRISKKPH